MLRSALAMSLLMAWHAALPAQSGEVPGMPADPAAVDPPPRVESGESREGAGRRPDTRAEGDEAVPPPPVLPDPVESGEPIEPEVTIIQREDAEIEEYRHNGRLYMVKVTPRVGKPYYLVDSTGDGRLESRRSQLYDDNIVPQWILFSW